MHIVKTLWFQRVFPFALYLLFILLSDGLKPFIPRDFLDVWFTPVMYFFQILSVAAALIYFWKFYDELQKVNYKFILLSILTGALVFVLWIHMDWRFAVFGEPKLYDPHMLPVTWYYVFIVIRILGSSLIVPIVEELFWRSFIIRYILYPNNFSEVSIGAFSWSSFLISAGLFGLEHYYIAAGIAAGLIYNLLLYKTKNILNCIIAHGVTNFMLGVYIVMTGKWHFW